MEQLIRFFKGRKIAKILDVGTGTGDFLSVLKDVFPGAEITGVDPNEESLIKAAARFPDVRFKKMSAEKIGFPNNSFDVVTISMALHHLSDVGLALREIKRVTKPGGSVIINELFSDNLNKAQEVHKLYHHFGSQIDRILGINHNPAFKKREIFQEVENAGIRIQFHFEFVKEENIILTSAEIEERVRKMKRRLETVKDHTEYKNLESQIPKFEGKVVRFGFQSATRIVIVGEG
jgi:ubiquinone/menaquinone biosynthesis C-methylase UbiE